MMTAAGSGYSRWHDLAITRWRADVTSDDTGSYIFLRDVASGERWSAGFQPTGAVPLSYDVSFADDRAAFIRHDGSIETRLEIIVPPRHDAEVRRVSLTNHGSETRDIEATSYAEIVLASAASDLAHPAFSNLFVQTECLAARNTLLATRRRSTPDDTKVWLAHVVAVAGDTIGDLEWETDRGRFLGRGRRARAPLAEAGDARLSGTVGSVLDPIVSLRRRVRIPAGGTARLSFSTMVAPSRAAVLRMATKYRDATIFDGLAARARAHAASRCRRIGMSPDEAQRFQVMAGEILYGDPSLCEGSDAALGQTSRGIEELWAHGISGDHPIVLVELTSTDDLDTVRQLLRARAYWDSMCLAVDLVIVNDHVATRTHALQTSLEKLVRGRGAAASVAAAKAHGKSFALRGDALSGVQRAVLETVARIRVTCQRGLLADQLALLAREPAPAPLKPRARRAPATIADAPPKSFPQLECFNGTGGFDAEANEYVTILRTGQCTPAPWINVIANPNFGCLVSESGAGCTWSVNSQENLLTPWSNDPVSDSPSDMFYLRDEDTGELWSPTPLPVREARGEYVVRHGHGYTRFAREAHGVALDLLYFVPVDDPIRIARLTVTNRLPHTRRLSVTAYLEWVLGKSRTETARFVRTEMDPVTGAMFAHNAWSRDFGTRVAFADLCGAQTMWTGDRTEFLGRHGASDYPAALADNAPLSGRTGHGLDPCCALAMPLELAAGATASVVLLLGETASREHARELIQRYRTDGLDTRLVQVTDQWTQVLGAVQVTTPDRALDLMLNQWLLYQTLSCRLWGRTAFYQASGAYGFRDQLQDVMALVVTRPDLTRAQILKAASRQFHEGDVQHWWHEPVGRGVRTRISDDLLWLPYVASHYLAVTGDRAILNEEIPFLEGPVLADGQNDAYFAPSVSDVHGTLFEHGARALDRSLAVGAHCLPLMGSGDWNDGMNRVGVDGKGESVWLAWFLHANLVAWAKLAAGRGEARRAGVWAEHARAIQSAVEREAWDGAWYRRAYFDDGTPLGTAGAGACAIDAIAQSWSVISGAADRTRARRAMESLDQHLVRRNHKLVLLLTPPFDKTKLEPGYIKGYVPGIRENGGQYTHAAVWSVIAFAELGDGDRAAELFAMLNPINHSSTPRDVQRYRVEPYVSVGDIYSEPPHVGRGGWTWYSGSAGWMYRAGIEWLLGIRVHGTRLLIDPCIPAAWPGFSVALRHRSARYDIHVRNPGGVRHGVATISLDGITLGDNEVLSLADDGRAHQVRVVMAHPSATPDPEP